MKSVLGVARVVVFLLVTGVVAAVVLTRYPPPPWAFLTRQELSSCPYVENDPYAVDGPSAEGIPAAALDCLADARAQERGAELEVGSPTTEGESVISYYRVLPGRDGLEVFVNFRRGPLGGSARWEHLVCPGALSPEELGTCETA